MPRKRKHRGPERGRPSLGNRVMGWGGVKEAPPEKAKGRGVGRRPCKLKEPGARVPRQREDCTLQALKETRQGWRTKSSDRGGKWQRRYRARSHRAEDPEAPPATTSCLTGPNTPRDTRPALPSRPAWSVTHRSPHLGPTWFQPHPVSGIT